MWKEGTFFLSLCSQIQNWKLKIAPMIKGFKVSDLIPKNQSFFWSDSDKIPNSGKHLVKNCTCQLRVLVQLKNRWIKVSSLFSIGFFFWTEKAHAWNVYTKVRSPSVQSEKIIVEFEQEWFLSIRKAGPSPNCNDFWKMVVSNIGDTSNIKEGLASSLLSKVKRFFTSFC